MNNGQHRGRLRERTLQNQPMCIYCGGTAKAEQVDHMPPRTIFALRDRPAGLEFSACPGCNQGSRDDELAVSVFSRMYPDPETVEEETEVAGLFAKVAQRLPDLLVQMQPTPEQIRKFQARSGQLPVNANPLNANGDLINSAMFRFGAKLGQALHYEKTGVILPAAGTIAVRWFTNYQAFTDEIPAKLREIIGPVATLRQGKKEVSRQFAYTWAHIPDGSGGVYMARFREAFLTVTFVSTGSFRVDLGSDTSGIFRPGYLKEAKA